MYDSKPFFDYPVKNKQEAYEKLAEISRNDDYTAGNLLDSLYHQKYKIIVIGKLEEDDGATMFFYF